MASSVVKFKVPRKLEDKETEVSLEHWKNEFLVYAQRDAAFAPFLTNSWDPDKENFGFTGADAAVTMNACKMFVNHVVSFLKYPYWNHKIMDRSKSLKDIWKHFDTVFCIETSAESFLDLALITYDRTESYHSFLARIVYHIENNKAPANIEIDGISSGKNGDKMTITMMDLAITTWLQKIDQRLIHQVKVDYAVQIKEGKRLFELSPQISRAIPGMLEKLGNSKANYKLIANDDRSTTSDGDTSLYRISQRGGYRGQQRPSGRGARSPSDQCPAAATAPCVDAH